MQYVYTIEVVKGGYLVSRIIKRGNAKRGVLDRSLFITNKELMIADIPALFEL
jgi:hypothetical protein